MTKHRKHRRTKRKSQRQRGGFLGFGSSEDSSSSGEPGMFSNAMSSVTGATSNLVSGSEGYLQGVKDKSNSWFSGFSNPFSSSSSSSPSPSPSPAPSPSTEPTTSYNPLGGRRTRRRRGFRGGKGGLGLTYYASPVSDIKVAEPTTWLKGGSRRRKSRRHKRR
jgi:hypothetical protein